ncbi:GNAT family N-acetyltransferase [Vibrio viridaestus]|uniref:N-acetyltransferase n=1 Tax=Vibrio viridaestus TaxID=2487322 RepID=A0A3N9U6L1_9VIBR|nr:GNAT family N-acetyltransferase [Vibrio viridaestus]RQW63706.1 N-acetyltransferase [Vibrio viridaestus]
MDTIYTFSDERIAQLHSLFRHAWWAKERTLEETILCVKGSQLCVGIIDDQNHLVGFARVLSDYLFKALIFDVIVCPTQRGSGLGKQLITAIQTHEALSSVKTFELYCLPEMDSFYAQLGFSPEVGGVHLIRKVNDSY